MSNYKIISDSSCDLTKDLLEKYDIDIIPYYITFNGVDYLKEGVTITAEELYSKMRNEKAYPKTSLPPVQDYIDKFRPYVEKGIDVICVCLTSKFSGAYQCAVTSAGILKEEFPDSNIHVIDSESATIFQGCILLEMAKMNEKGYSFEKIKEISDYIKRDTAAMFTVDTLEYLQKGGRIGKVAAFAGSLFNIKPIIFLENGELIPNSKVMGRKKAINEIMDIFEQRVKGKEYLYNFTVACSDAFEEAENMKAILKEKGYSFHLPVSSIGATITVHAGPGTIAVGYSRKYESFE